MVEALSKRGITATVDGLSVVVEQESEVQYDAIRDALVEADARLRRLAPRRRHTRDPRQVALVPPVMGDLVHGRLMLTGESRRIELDRP